MKKIFAIADRFMRKLAEAKPDINSEKALNTFMTEEGLSQFRMGDVIYFKRDGWVYTRVAESSEERAMSDMSSVYLAWWQDWMSPEIEEPVEQHPASEELTSDDLDMMEENLTADDLRLVDRRINFIYEQLGSRLSKLDMELFTEAINLSARLEGWRQEIK